MVKKLKSISNKKSQAAGGLLDNQLASMVKDSAQQIWLAGMGAFAKAQQEGGKVFDALVKEGVNLQKKTQGLAEERISEVTGKMSAMAGDVTAKAGQSWDKLESIFEQRTAKALNRLGVPTAKDVDALVKRVDALAAAVAKLSKTELPAATRKIVARKTKAVQKVSVKPAVKVALEAAKEAAKEAAPKKAAAKRAPRRKAAVVAAEAPAA